LRKAHALEVFDARSLVDPALILDVSEVDDGRVAIGAAGCDERGEKKIDGESEENHVVQTDSTLPRPNNQAYSQFHSSASWRGRCCEAHSQGNCQRLPIESPSSNDKGDFLSAPAEHRFAEHGTRSAQKEIAVAVI
jgi:hypothetical protein